MCKFCWEQLGSPQETDLPAGWGMVAEDLQELFALRSMGGSLHIVVEDDNVDDDSLLWCAKNVRKYATSEPEVMLAERILKRMIPMTELQRAAVLAAYRGWL